MELYNLLISSLYVAVLLYILFAKRDVFSVKSYFFYVAGTWIMGALLCENGFFAWPLNYTPRPHNFSTLALLSFVTATYFGASLFSSALTKIRFKHKASFRVKQEKKYQYTGMFLLGLGATFILAFFNIYIIYVGAPFFSANANHARAMFWETMGLPQLQRVISLYLPAVIVFLSINLKKRRWLNIVFFLNVSTYIISNILLSQKSNILFLAVPLLLSFYYRFSHSLNVGVLVKRTALIGIFLLFFMGSIEYINLPNAGTLVFGQYQNKSFFTGLLVFVSRLSLGQGEPFWEIFQKWIIQAYVNPPLGMKGYGYYSQLITASQFLGRSAVIQENSFEYWITAQLTADWFAAIYNMVITYLGEGIVYFGVAGLFLNAAIASILLGMTDYLIKYFLAVGAYDKFIVVIMIFSSKIIAWLQMGNIFNLIKVTELMYLLILYGFVAFIVNYLPQRRIATPGYQHG